MRLGAAAPARALRPALGGLRAGGGGIALDAGERGGAAGGAERGEGEGGGGDGTRPRGGRSSAGGGVPGGFGLARLRDDARGALLEDGVHARGEGFPATAARRRSSASLNATYSVSTASRPLTPAGMRFLNGARRLRVLLELVHRLWGGGGGVGGEGRAAGGERGWKGSRRFDRGGAPAGGRGARSAHISFRTRARKAASREAAPAAAHLHEAVRAQVVVHEGGDLPLRHRIAAAGVARGRTHPRRARDCGAGDRATRREAPEWARRRSSRASSFNDDDDELDARARCSGNLTSSSSGKALARSHPDVRTSVRAGDSARSRLDPRRGPLAPPPRAASGAMSASPPDRPLPPCVPFLPRDNDAADPDAAAVTTLLDQRLATLLHAPADAFWRHVAHDASLRRAIDTYLQFRRRPHDADDDADSPAASSSDDALRRSASLAKRVFNTYRRLATPSEPGSPFRGPDDHARALRASALAEPPCVLDVCAIFGRDNPRETAELVKTLHAILDLASPFAAAAKSAAEGLERTADELLHAAFENDTPGVPAAKRDDALRYFHDVAATVHAVARASPELAAAMTEGDERASTDDTKGKAPATSSSDRRASNASASALADAMDRVANETIPTLAANAPANVARAAETVSAAPPPPGDAPARRERGDREKAIRSGRSVGASRAKRRRGARDAPGYFPGPVGGVPRPGARAVRGRRRARRGASA